MDSRRKTIIINREFQIQFSLMMLALAVVLINGLFIYRALFPVEHSLAVTSSLTWGLILAEIVVLGAVWYASLQVSNRIAGPVYVFAREISKLEAGDLTVRIALRDRDLFKPEAAKITSAVDSLRVKIDVLKDLSVQLQHAHASGADVGELLEQLHQELSTVTTVPEDYEE